MLILGMHFGHDASITIVGDGVILSHVLRERHARVKHAVGLTTRELDMALDTAGVSIADIDYCAIVSTQDLELITGLIDDFTVAFADPSGDKVPAPAARLYAAAGMAPDAAQSYGLKRLLAGEDDASLELLRGRWQSMFPEWQQYRDGKLDAFGWLNRYTTHEKWESSRSLKKIERDGFGAIDETLKFGMHYPVAVTCRGRKIPGYFVDHHVCHGASSYYRSGFDAAAVFSNDGGDPRRNLSGYLMYGQGSDLYVLSPHNLMVGGLYRSVGAAVGFDILGSEGKLMGLASYGEPAFLDKSFIGNFYDLERRHGADPVGSWINHCLEKAGRLGYERQFGDPQNVLGKLSVDVAASTQALFEETCLRTVQVQKTILRKAGLSAENLCLSGGCALNCPGNSRINASGLYSELFIEPNCDDGGLSVGAALYTHHNLLGQPLDANAVHANKSPFKGANIPESEIVATVDAAREKYQVTRPENRAQAAAGDLHGNRLVAWFDGRSEMGPRALCHRSLLANPTIYENWARVNVAKQREQWRPLAPVVLESKASEWFGECPEPSPYMLFTAKVKGNRLPAVTHVDGTARIQTLSEETGEIHDVAQQFEHLSGVPVILNTSLNGPGEPIVERPAEALRFFEAASIDVLYIDGYRISRD
ncbi:MAG: hypothetical protein HKN59_04125 [Gammaproteobacteria bacterium]|nr:hypothetical protein [Gammaproteobacteria bacterium]